MTPEYVPVEKSFLYAGIFVKIRVSLSHWINDSRATNFQLNASVKKYATEVLWFLICVALLHNYPLMWLLCHSNTSYDLTLIDIHNMASIWKKITRSVCCLFLVLVLVFSPQIFVNFCILRWRIYSFAFHITGCSKYSV